MKQITILLLFLLPVKKILAQDWIYVGSDINGNKVFVKSSYVSKGGDFDDGNVIKIWTKKQAKVSTIFKKGRETKVYNVTILSLLKYDCTERKSKLIAQTTYSSNGATVDSFKLEDYEQKWTDVVPDSIGEAILDKVCELFNE